MKSQTITTVLAAVVILAGIFALGYAGRGGTAASIQNTGLNAGGVLTAQESLYDFGTISMRNGDVSYDFVVTNPTDKDVKLSTVVTSCMCTNAFIVGADGSAKGPFGMPGHGGAVPPANETIKAGENRIIRVVYNPNAHGPAGVGRIDRTITLTDASGNGLQFRIKANVTP